jgi:indolepyruvate ferredoxin oxidoreductase
VQFPESSGLITAINRFTRKDENVFLDALGLAETLFGDHMAANFIVLGAAYQAGAIPVSAAAIEQAIAINGVSVSMNTQAFRAGRLLVVEPEWVKTVGRPRAGAVEVERLEPTRTLAAWLAPLTGETFRLAAIRVPELVEYQNRAYAQEYLDFVKKVAAAEGAWVPGRTELSEAVARYLFKLMAYKDEYEVARLHLKHNLAQSLASEYPDGVRIEYNLHPPMLRALGWKKKIKLGKWFDRVFRALVRMKALRGTALDPFGRAHVRRVERQLIREYRALVDKAMAALSPETYDVAVKLAHLPDMIRGYEDIKLNNVKRFRTEVARLGF